MEPSLLADWFTDPFCSWSYAAENSINIFRNHFGKRLSFRHRLFPLYKNIGDFLQSHGLKSQKDFAPRIEKVSRATGVFMSPKVWESEQAPTSSEDYCLLAEAALLLDADKGGLLLSRMRELAFLEGKNIGEPSLFFETAASLGLEKSKIDEILKSGRAMKSLEEDREAALREGVKVRPTLILTNTEGDRVFVGGLRNHALFILAGETLIQEAS